MALLRPDAPPRAARPCGRASPRRALTALALVLLAAAAPRAEHAEPTEHEIKAAFLYNFVSFVKWPARAPAEEALVIGVLGKDPFGPALENILAGERHEGRALVVRRFKSAEDAAAAHVLFVSVPDSDLEATLSGLASSPVLTVGESRDFIRHGGMIQFKVVDGRVRFEVNVEAAEKADLKVSSHLLKLALRVHGADRRRTD